MIVEIIDLSHGILDVGGMSTERYPRTPGLHESDVIHWIDDKLGISRKNKSPIDTDLWEQAGPIGFLWEDLFSSMLASRAVVGKDLIRGLELDCDGILMSPDGVDVVADDGLGEGWEFKFTWMSSNTLPHDVWRWMAQIKNYAKATGIMTWNMAVLYCCGTYRPPAPVLVGERITFTAQDIEENWRMMMNAIEPMQAERILKGLDRL